jgi:hypothetical protein
MADNDKHTSCFHCSLIFVGKARTLTYLRMECHKRCTRVGSSLTRKYLTRVEITGSDKNTSYFHSSLIFVGNARTQTTLRAKSHNGVHSGRLQPYMQIFI